MFWGEPGPDASRFYDSAYRWDTLAAELGRAVHELCPRWLIFVQGVGECRDDVWDKTKPGIPPPCSHYSAAANHDMSLKAGIWWGGELCAQTTT